MSDSEKEIKKINSPTSSNSSSQSTQSKKSKSSTKSKNGSSSPTKSPKNTPNKSPNKSPKKSPTKSITKSANQKTASTFSKIETRKLSRTGSDSKCSVNINLSKTPLDLKHTPLPESSETKKSTKINSLSEIEAAILRSNEPIELTETDEIEVLGLRGILANKDELVNWKGEIPLCNYIINDDPNPEIITKKTKQKIHYIQQLAIRYLKPPTPPPPGEIIIKQEPNKLTPPAPPLVIRQQPPKPKTPVPIVIREAPPSPPKNICRKVIRISGKKIPPPLRKVVIERLAPLPSKPQSVMIERWLPYKEIKRRVIYQKSGKRDAVIVKPKNIIIQWEPPTVVVKREFKYLGIVKANPCEYVLEYGSSLKLAKDLPEVINEIKTPECLVLAADKEENKLHELEGDLDALKLVDLEKEGLGSYKDYLLKLGIIEALSKDIVARSSSILSEKIDDKQSVITVNETEVEKSRTSSPKESEKALDSASISIAANSSRSSSQTSLDQESKLNIFLKNIFETIDTDNDSKITKESALDVFNRLNERLGEKYNKDQMDKFAKALVIDENNLLGYDEFIKAFKLIAF